MSYAGVSCASDDRFSPTSQSTRQSASETLGKFADQEHGDRSSSSFFSTEADGASIGQPKPYQTPLPASSQRGESSEPSCRNKAPRTQHHGTYGDYSMRPSEHRVALKPRSRLNQINHPVPASEYIQVDPRRHQTIVNYNPHSATPHHSPRVKHPAVSYAYNTGASPPEVTHHFNGDTLKGRGSLPYHASGSVSNSLTLWNSPGRQPFPNVEHDSFSSTGYQFAQSPAGDFGSHADHHPVQNSFTTLLPPLMPFDGRRKCLVLDLDQTLIYSDWEVIGPDTFMKPTQLADLTFKANNQGTWYVYHTYKRPFVEQFLNRVVQLNFEVVLFTAGFGAYAIPVVNMLENSCGRRIFSYHLFRQQCREEVVSLPGSPPVSKFIKDLSRLGRDLSRVVIIDDSPQAYESNPENALPIRKWTNDKHDCELLRLLPVLEHLSRTDKDVRDELSEWRTNLEICADQARANRTRA